MNGGWSGAPWVSLAWLGTPPPAAGAPGGSPITQGYGTGVALVTQGYGAAALAPAPRSGPDPARSTMIVVGPDATRGTLAIATASRFFSTMARVGPDPLAATLTHL